MKIYLLLTDDGRRLFYADVPESADGDHHAIDHPGLRGWFERKAKHLKSVWTHAEHGVTAKLRGVWTWLQRRTYADESLLVRLRSAPVVELHHPAALSEEEVRALWAEYLSGRRRRHVSWLGINALISPLTIVLAPLPGPNMVGYWFAYRAVRHLLAILGLRRVRGDHVAVTLHPNTELDRPVSEAGGSAERVVAPLGDPKELDEFLRRSGVPREGVAASAAEARQ